MLSIMWQLPLGVLLQICVHPRFLMLARRELDSSQTGQARLQPNPRSTSPNKGGMCNQFFGSEGAHILLALYCIAVTVVLQCSVKLKGYQSKCVLQCKQTQSGILVVSSCKSHEIYQLSTFTTNTQFHIWARVRVGFTLVLVLGLGLVLYYNLLSWHTCSYYEELTKGTHCVCLRA